MHLRAFGTCPTGVAAGPTHTRRADHHNQRATPLPSTGSYSRTTPPPCPTRCARSDGHIGLRRCGTSLGRAWPIACPTATRAPAAPTTNARCAAQNNRCTSLRPLAVLRPLVVLRTMAGTEKRSATRPGPAHEAAGIRGNGQTPSSSDPKRLDPAPRA